MRNILLYISLLCFSILCFNSCDAPHNNILDPENPDAHLFYYVEGRVTKIDEVQQIPTAVSNIKVSLEKEGLYTRTDINGYYKLKCYNRIDQNIIFEGAHFFSDTLAVSWNNEKNIEINANLSYKPEPDSIINYSIVDWYIDVEQKALAYAQSLFIQFKISKLDLGRIDSIILVNTDLKINTCVYNSNSESSTSEIKLPIEKFKIKDLDEVTGKKFSIYIYTISKKMYHYKDIVFMRTIKESAVGVSPVNGELITSEMVSFKWTPLNSTYKCYYKVQIYNDQYPPYEFLDSSGIFESSVSVYNSTLNQITNLYKLSWRIVSIDEFGNRNLSIPFTFIYRPNSQ